MALAGLGAGVLAGMGMGGGTVLIPALTMLLGVSQQGAQGVNMLSFLPGAALALWIHRREGRLDIRSSLPIIFSGVAASAAGALLASMIEGALLRKGFGVFLMLLSAAQLMGRLARRQGNGD